MLVSVGPYFSYAKHLWQRSLVPRFIGLGGQRLGRASSARIWSGWLAAGYALALICAGPTPRALLAQSAATPSKTDSQTQAKTTNSKNHSTPASKSAGAGTLSAKAHAAPHSTANARSKTTTANRSRSGKSKQASARRNGKHKTVARGQQKIDPERAQAIQEALIREHYLSGEAAETWNQASEDAMRRYQADHGWQSKTVPDSRALISLGLGPSHDHLLNPQSAMTTGADASRAAALTPASHSADPGARLNPTPTSPTGSTPVSSSGQDASGPQ